jgi:predicted MFS family arabinose efflux permease
VGFPGLGLPGVGLLRDRDFRWFWLGETTSTAGSAMAVVAMPLTAVLVLHASTLVVGLLQATAWLPALLFGLPAGAWVDRRRKRPVMLACDLAAFVLFASVPVAAWAGVLTIGQLVAVAFGAGTAAVFFSTSFGPFVRAVVSAENRPEANAKLEGSTWAAQLAGPGLGGLAAQLLGAVSGLLANALSFVVSAFCLTRIRAVEPAPEPRPGGSSLRAEIGEGLRFLVRDPYLRVVIVYMGAGNFGDCAMEAVVVVFLVRTVGVGPGLAGTLVATMGVGGVIGAMLATRIGRRLGTARGMLLCTVFTSPFMLLVPATSRGAGLVLFAVGTVVYVTGVAATNVIAASFSQTYVPARLLGRYGGAVNLLIRGTQPLGAVTGAVAGEALGPRAAMWIAAAAITLSAGILFTGPLRRERDLPAAPGSVTRASGRL